MNRFGEVANQLDAIREGLAAVARLKGVDLQITLPKELTKSRRSTTQSPT